LKPDSVVVAEHFKKQPAPVQAGKLTLYREAQYGDTVLAFYKL
jgi:16S rRNA G966 N2-methylase RsmD